MAITRIEEINDECVVVPDFIDSGYGMVGVARGDMTDAEWRTWNKVRGIPEVKRIMKNEQASTTSAKIIEYLTEKGIAVCRTNQPRPIF